MRLSELTDRDLKERATRGLTISTPPFVVRLQTPLKPLQQSMRTNYGVYDILDDDVVPDFLIRISGTGGLHRFVHKQCMAYIDIATPFVPLPQSKAPLMFEQAMNWTIGMRVATHMLFHAAIVEKDDRAVIILGKSGQGKSTLCASLVASGWRYFSDEVAMLDIQTGLAQPYPRPVSLKNESVAAMKAYAPEWPISKTYTGTPKGNIAYMLPRREHIEAAMTPAKPVGILTPHFVPGAEPLLEKVAQSTAFLQMLTGSINYGGFGEEGFTFLSELTNRIPAVTARYGDIEAGVRLVEDFMGSP